MIIRRQTVERYGFSVATTVFDHRAAPKGVDEPRAATARRPTTLCRDNANKRDATGQQGAPLPQPGAAQRLDRGHAYPVNPRHGFVWSASQPRMSRASTQQFRPRS